MVNLPNGPKEARTDEKTMLGTQARIIMFNGINFSCLSFLLVKDLMFDKNMHTKDPGLKKLLFWLDCRSVKAVAFGGSLEGDHEAASNSPNRDSQVTVHTVIA